MFRNLKIENLTWIWLSFYPPFIKWKSNLNLIKFLSTIYKVLVVAGGAKGDEIAHSVEYLKIQEKILMLSFKKLSIIGIKKYKRGIKSWQKEVCLNASFPNILDWDDNFNAPWSMWNQGRSCWLLGVGERRGISRGSFFYPSS